MFSENTIQVHLSNKFTFNIVLLTHQICKTEYQTNLFSYLIQSKQEQLKQENNHDMISLDWLNLNFTALLSESLLLKKCLIYFSSKLIDESIFEKIFLIMKYLYLKNLQYQHAKDSIKKLKVQQLFLQKIDVLQYFHSWEIIHWNIKSANIFIKH